MNHMNDRLKIKLGAKQNFVMEGPLTSSADTEKLSSIKPPKKENLNPVERDASTRIQAILKYDAI